MKVTAEDLIPHAYPLDNVVAAPSLALPLNHLDKFPIILNIPDKVWKIGVKIGTDDFYTLIAKALFNVAMNKCITGNAEFIKKLDLTNDEINCISTWLDKEESELKQKVTNWRNHILNVLFNNYKDPKTTFSEYKAKHFISLWTRYWLDRLANKAGPTLTANELITHLVETHINLDKLYLDAWVKYEIPGGMCGSDMEMLEACVEHGIIEVEEREEQPKQRGEFLASNGLRELITGPQGNRYPSAKRRKGSK